MISGAVESVGAIGSHPVWKPRVVIPISNGTGGERDAKFTVDTGFTGWLTLPYDVIVDLGLLWQGTRAYTLADGSEAETDLYLAFFASSPIVVHQINDEPLLGAVMMNECRLTVDFWEGGCVTVTPRAELA